MDKHKQRPMEAGTVVTPQISNVVRDNGAKGALVQSNHITDEVCDHDDPDSKRQYVNLLAKCFCFCPPLPSFLFST